MLLEDVSNLVVADCHLRSMTNMSFISEDLTKCGYVKIYEIIRDNGWLPKILPRAEKSSRMSQKYRAEGNEAYVRSKDNLKAILLYSKAICAALPGSNELAIAHANRSAVTYDLREYKDSIRDIDWALSNGTHPQRMKLYERRGKCFLALSQFSKAMEDFHLAKNCLAYQTQLSQEKMIASISLLDNLIKECQDKPDKPQCPLEDSIKLSHEPSSYIQCASAAVEIEYSSKMGRHVVAARDIKPGDILAIEKRYASVLKSSNFYSICSHCKKKGFSTLPCPSCDGVVFCSEECRLASWEAYHSIECGILPTLNILFADTDRRQMDLRMALRLLLIASKCGKDLPKLMEESKRTDEPSKSRGFVDGKYLSDNYRSIHHLATCSAQRGQNEMIHLAVHATCLMHVLQEGSSFFDSIGTTSSNNAGTVNSLTRCQQPAARRLGASCLSLNHLNVAYLILRYWMITEMCGYSTVPLVGEIDAADDNKTISAFHGLFNHSCDPNVTHYACRGDRGLCMAVQPIRKGQQIFACYGVRYQTEPLYQRRDWLKRSYYFTCECHACVKKWPLAIALPKEPRFTKTDAIRDVILICQGMQSMAAILREIEQNRGTKDHFEFLIDFLTRAFEIVELPWLPYSSAQMALEHYMDVYDK